MERKKKERVTTYFFPNHFSALREIADASGKSVANVLAEALDTYLEEVGAIDTPQTVRPRPEDVREHLERHRKTGD